MATSGHTYLKDLIGAEINEEANRSTFVFQKERFGFKRSSEIIFLKEVNPEITKEIVITDDELIIQADIPNSFKRFDEIQSEDAKSRWMFAHQLVEKVDAHPYPRLNLIVCPENMVYSKGMTPVFIYFGVTESLPPFRNNIERVWLETRAAVAAAVDGSFTYEEFLKYNEVLELNETCAKVMGIADSRSLLDYIEQQLELLDEKEKGFVKLPRKKWKTTKWLSIGLGVLLIPALLFTIIYFIHEKPKNEAYIDSHEYFLERNYSQVVTVLSPYSIKSMPYVMLYELAHSFVTNERLDEEQKKNVLSNITLQTDSDYLKYWIYLGRGEAANAVDLARSMEDGELITFGLLKRREEIQADQKLTGEEKQYLLEEIDREVEEYEKLMKQNEEDEEEKVEVDRQEKAEEQERIDKVLEQERIDKALEQEKVDKALEQEKVDKVEKQEKTEKVETVDKEPNS
ncbi:type VII secretion protein EssB [Sporosarcina sp. ANT_H38]|uniref:type VII secretion protein EssB n=1 Tax=Sporosarcina sp. ANT_H38 TaxID=2597358 RepID=UPI0011F23949|nr:type VII secretion protein EssB [Sporosarcina sp. ANT_H38]KAA0955572.1 type VII secretion protein EssB [Sporosarcina sp. ANT_H38]